MLAIDFDGVVADFVYGFTSVAHKLYGTRIVSGGGQNVWDWGDKFTLDQVNTVWREIDASPSFWSDLPPLAGPGELVLLRQLPADTIFLTNRKPYTVEQTKQWTRYMLDVPFTIHHVRDKATFAKEFGVTHIIEDSPRNIPNLQAAGIDVSIRDWPYNRGIEGKRVTSLGEWIVSVS